MPASGNLDQSALLSFLEKAASPVAKRDIARQFHLKSDQKIVLKHVLRELVKAGKIKKFPGRRYGLHQSVPSVCLVEIQSLTEDGDLVARPIFTRHSSQTLAKKKKIEASDDYKVQQDPIIILETPETGRRHRNPKTSLSKLTVGDRALLRLSRADTDGDIAYPAYHGKLIKQIIPQTGDFICRYHLTPDGGRLYPVDKERKGPFIALVDADISLKDDDLVVAQMIAGRRYGLNQAKILKRLGSSQNPKLFSQLALHKYQIPTDFPAEAISQAEQAVAVTPDGREDLRHVPFVTIDGADARDFDDAVFAEKDSDPDNPDGWHLMVAIADVAHYVPVHSALDKEAYKRGNSVYFPDKVVPMLPEALSNGWCSLRPDEDRGCLAVHIWLDKNGQKIRHQFCRGIIRSRARLTYEQTQQAWNGTPDELTAPILADLITPLYQAYQLLAQQRQERGALELDLPEKRVILNPETGHIDQIGERARLDSHCLIEEFMILANVCAAETLEKHKAPCMYRVHDQPDAEKAAGLAHIVTPLGLKFSLGQVLRPDIFTRLLQQAKQTPYQDMVNDLVLRCQSQAAYAPQNLGHFGLALPKYAHFTSPIRRYSDLLVHRALLYYGAVIPRAETRQHESDQIDLDRFADQGVHISDTERRAALAERDVTDRYLVHYLSQFQHETLQGRVTSVTRFGLFIRLEKTGADGLIPIMDLPEDFYDLIPQTHQLVGHSTGRIFQLGHKIEVKIAQADTDLGRLSLSFEKQLDSELFATAAERQKLFKLARSAGEDIRGPHRRSRRPSDHRSDKRGAGKKNSVKSRKKHRKK